MGKPPNVSNSAQLSFLNGCSLKHEDGQFSSLKATRSDTVCKSSAQTEFRRTSWRDNVEAQGWLHRPFPTGALVLPDSEPFFGNGGERALAQVLVDNVCEFLLVLDNHLNVVTASGSFYRMFGLSRGDVQGRPVYALADGRWNLAGLRLLVERIALPKAAAQADRASAAEGPVVARDATPGRKQPADHREHPAHDVPHMAPEETRQHLLNAHRRVMSVASLQHQLQVSQSGGAVELGPYPSRLCETLAVSLIDERQPIELNVEVKGGTIVQSICARRQSIFVSASEQIG